MHPGLIGAIVGCVIGLIGGMIGTHMSIKNTNGPKERAFMIRGAVWFWIGAIVFLTLLLTIPRPYNFLVWLPYGIALPLAIITINKKQARLRQEEKA